MAELQDTHIHGDLAVDGSISPWGGGSERISIYRNSNDDIQSWSSKF